MKIQLFLIFIVLRLTSCLNTIPSVTFCDTPPSGTERLGGKMILPTEYKIIGSITDWKRMKTQMIAETGIKDYRVMERKSMDSEEKWIEDLRDGSRKWVNSTGCEGRAEKLELFSEGILGMDTSSITNIIHGITESDFKGFVLKDQVSIVGGINSNTWISCINRNDSKFLLEVKYTDQDSVKPAMNQFSGPLILSIRIADLKSKNHWSIEIDRFEIPKGDESCIPKGMICKHIEESSIQLKILDEYAAIINYENHRNKTSQIAEILYSKSRQQFIVFGEPLRNVLNAVYPPRVDYVLHDFKYGYEMTMSHGACQQFVAIPNTRDAILQSQGFVIQSPMNYILIPSYLAWNQYGNGMDHVEYRSKDVVNDAVWELRLTKDMEILSYKVYDFDSATLLYSMKVNRIPMEKSKLNTNPVRLSACYDDGQEGNNTWILPIKNKILNDMNRVGLDQVNDAVVKSISTNIHSVIPYRIVAFYVENQYNQLSLILRISEKTVMDPSKTHGYNYSSELSTDELSQMIKEGILKGKISFEVENIDGDKETWIPESMIEFSFQSTIQNPPKTSDSSQMILLVIFSLFAGFLIGGIVVFLLTRKTRKVHSFSNINLTLPTKC